MQLKKTDQSKEAIHRLLLEMADHEPGSPEYQKRLDAIERLNQVRVSNRPNRISWDTALNVAGSLAGILAVLNFEKKDVITSKAFGLIGRKPTLK